MFLVEIGWKFGTSSTDVCSSFRRFKDPNQSEELGVAPVMPSKTKKQPSHFLQWGRTKISRYVWGQGATPTSLQLFKNSGAGWLEEWSETLGASLTLLSCKLTYPHPRIPKVYLKIWRYFFLFPRWDMLVPPRYLTPKTARHSTKPSANPSRKLPGCSWAGTTAD